MVTRNSAFVLWDEGFFICRIQEEEDMIRLEHVSKTFDSRAGNVHAVQDVTLTLYQSAGASKQGSSRD